MRTNPLAPAMRAVALVGAIVGALLIAAAALVALDGGKSPPSNVPTTATFRGEP